MIKRFSRAVLVIFAILIFPINAFCSKISLGTIVVDFNDPKTKFIDVPVYNVNEDGSKAYVKTSVLEVLNPGTKDESRIEVAKNQKQSLIVSPQKMVIPFKGQKNIRLVSLYNDLQKDKVFRVRVEPIIAKVESTAKRAVKVLIAYEALIIVRPSQIKPSLEGKREGNKIFFKNTGNTSILVRGATQCPTNNLDPDKCKEIPGFRLYSGNSYEVDLPFDSKVDFAVNFGNNSETRSF